MIGSIPRSTSQRRRGLLSYPRSATSGRGNAAGVPADETASQPRWRRSCRGAGPPPGTPSPGMLPAEYQRHRPEASTSYPCLASSSRLWHPLLGGGEAAVRETLVPTQLLAIIQIREERAPHRQQRPVLLPSAKAPPASRRAPISAREL